MKNKTLNFGYLFFIVVIFGAGIFSRALAEEEKKTGKNSEDVLNRKDKKFCAHPLAAENSPFKGQIHRPSIASLPWSSFSSGMEKQNMLALSGAEIRPETLYFSPEGSFIVLEKGDFFFIFDLDHPEKFNCDRQMLYGKMLGFLPSGHLLYLAPEGIFKLDVKTHVSRKIMENYSGYPDSEKKYFTIVSNSVAVFPFGAMGVRRYNLENGERDFINYNVAENRVIGKLVSSGKRYLAFIAGDESHTTSFVFDVENDAVIYLGKIMVEEGLSEYYDIIARFWQESGHRLLALLWDEAESKGRLALFDLPGKKILWHTQVEDAFHGQFQQLDANTALVSSAYSKGAECCYELSLKDGKMKTSGRFTGNAFSISPGKTQIAYLRLSDLTETTGTLELFLTDINGKKHVKIFEKKNWYFISYAPYTPPVYSHDGKYLFIYGHEHLLIFNIRP